MDEYTKYNNLPVIQKYIKVNEKLNICQLANTLELFNLKQVYIKDKMEYLSN